MRDATTVALSWARARSRVFEVGDARRQHENRDEIARNVLEQLLGALPIDVADDVAASGKRLLDRPPRRAVAISEDFRVLQQLTPAIISSKRAAVDKTIIPPVDLSLPRRPRRDRNRKRSLRLDALPAGA